MTKPRKHTQSELPMALLVDDEPAVLESLQAILEQEFRITQASTGQEALRMISEQTIDLVFLDIKLPDADGIDILRKIKEFEKSASVIMATAMDSARTAVQALQLGACGYITKPFDVTEVQAVAKKAIADQRLLKEVVCLRSQRDEVGFDNIIGKSKKMKEVYDLIKKVASVDATVFICGESGTGKELIARAIHFNGERRYNPFVPINCASIPETLLESELFGYEKGAFTGAIGQKLGMFELANEGTLFLDEISSLKRDLQVNLLRVLEEKEIRRIGGTKTIKINVRIISATNIDLRQAVRDDKFRQDLYYRLNVVPIMLPPLRERKEDIPLLVDYFIGKFNQAFRKNISGIETGALDHLLAYDWPGNVRELKNVIERLVALKDNSTIQPKDLPFDIFIESALSRQFGPEGMLKEASQDFQKRYIKAVLDRVGGNQLKASKILGIHRNALSNKMKSFGLKKDL